MLGGGWTSVHDRPWGSDPGGYTGLARERESAHATRARARAQERVCRLPGGPRDEERAVPGRLVLEVLAIEDGPKALNQPNVCEICGQPAELKTPHQYGEAIRAHFERKERGGT